MKVTCDTILKWMQEQVENKTPIAPDLWLDAAEKLNILSSDETDKLFALQQLVALMRVQKLQELNNNATAAKIYIEASDEYREARKQGAKIEMIKEQVRLAKMRGRIKSDELRSGV